jgi:predicted MFS family arabinose efflux permease
MVRPTKEAMTMSVQVPNKQVTELMRTPAFFSAIFATAEPSQRGAASGTASAAIDIGLGLGPIVFGLVAGQFGIPQAIGVGAAIAATGALWTLTLHQRTTVSMPGTH